MSDETRETEWDSLTRKTRVRRVYWFREIPSTNDWAKEELALVGRKSGKTSRLDSPLSLPFLVIADRQTSGRGRGNHRWWSPEGGIFLSLVASRKDFKVAKRESVELSLTIAQGVAGTIDHFLTRFFSDRGKITDGGGDDSAHSVTVKHPNDVYLGGKKIAGILIESPTPDRVIVGIGVNLNNSSEKASSPIRDRIVSLRDVIGVQTDPIQFVTILINKLFDDPVPPL